MKGKFGIDLSQRSTYAGITALLGALGIGFIPPEMALLAVQGLFGVIGAIGTFIKD